MIQNKSKCESTTSSLSVGFCKTAVTHEGEHLPTEKVAEGKAPGPQSLATTAGAATEQWLAPLQTSAVGVTELFTQPYWEPGRAAGEAYRVEDVSCRAFYQVLEE